MKKLNFLIFLMLLISLGIVYSQPDSVGVGLTIADTAGPGIRFLGLANNSGISSRNFTFLFNASDTTGIGSCRMIVDNKLNFTNASFQEGFNGTIKHGRESRFRLHNLGSGSFNFSINCTDSLGFVASSDKYVFHVVLAEGFNGSSTDISQVNVGSIKNFVSEVSTLGKINFSEIVNLEGGYDLAKYINITSNKISLDAENLAALNKSATLYLYDLSFTDPRALIDGEACPSTICTEVSYAGGTFAFNVTHFSAYSSEETPATSATTTTASGGSGASGGGGGGGGAFVAEREFTLNRETLKVTLKQGQSKEESLTIENTGQITLNIKTYLQTIKEFIVSPLLEEIGIILDPDEGETINLIFEASENQTPNIYTGEIRVKSGSTEKIISTIIEVESAKPLFDVDVEVLPRYKKVSPGDEIIIDVSAFNVRGFGRVDVSIEYSIMDFQGNIITKEEETIAVETQAKFTRELLVPSDLSPGNYIAAAKITFGDSVGISSDVFEVSAKAIRLYPIEIKDYTFYLLLAIVFVVFSGSVYLLYEFKGKKGYKPKTREETTKVVKSEDKVSKLEKELSALEQAFKSKFISKESYNRDKERIEKQLKKLGK